MLFPMGILSALYPVKNYRDRVSNNRQHEGTLNVTGLTFPMSVKNVPTFEKFNPDISINVLCKGDEDGYVLLCVNKERNRSHHVNLFLVGKKDKHGNDLQHYVWITDLSRLVHDRTNHQHRTYVSNHCLHPFLKQDVLERHTPNCERHPHQHVKYPNSTKPKKCIAKFCNLSARFRLQFYLVCDFESF